MRLGTRKRRINVRPHPFRNVPHLAVRSTCRLHQATLRRWLSVILISERHPGDIAPIVQITPLKSVDLAHIFRLCIGILTVVHLSSLPPLLTREPSLLSIAASNVNRYIAQEQLLRPQHALPTMDELQAIQHFMKLW